MLLFQLFPKYCISELYLIFSVLSVSLDSRISNTKFLVNASKHNARPSLKCSLMDEQRGRPVREDELFQQGQALRQCLTASASSLSERIRRWAQDGVIDKAQQGFQKRVVNMLNDGMGIWKCGMCVRRKVG